MSTRWSLRSRLAAIVGAGALGFVLVVVVGWLIDERVHRELITIQQSYVPKVELGPRLTAQFEKLQRAFQDAVAAHDRDTLNDAKAVRDDLFTMLHGAEIGIGSANATTLRWAVEQYYAIAVDVADRLMRDETGEPMLRTLSEMRDREHRVIELIDTYTLVDRRVIDTTFATIIDAQHEAAMFRSLVALAFMVAVGASSLIWSRRLITALEALVRGFARFGDNQLDHRIAIADHDEIGDVAQHANLMAERLQTLMMRHAQSEAALELANRELEAFSYSVAHDLRAPLRGMNGFAQLLLDGHADKLDAEGKDWLGEIAANASKMGTLIDALLALSRLTRAELHREPVDLSAIARETAADLALASPERKVAVVVQDGLNARADIGLMRAALANLIGNAWKFTAKTAAPCVEFGTTSPSGVQCYFVRDNGAGFDMAYAKKLFAPFQRLHTVAEFPGTGIGLATTQRIIHRHGGRIWAEGTVNGGATFFFTLGAETKVGTA